MATLADNLKTRRTSIGVELAAMSASTAGGVPTYSAPNGQSFDHVGYKRALYEELSEINKALAMLEPMEIISEVVS